VCVLTCRAVSWSVKGAQWNRASPRYGLQNFHILFLSNTTCSITITKSDFPFLLPRFYFLFLFCCLVLGLLESGPLVFGVRLVFFKESGLRFFMYTVVIFTFGCIAYIRHIVFIFYKI